MDINFEVIRGRWPRLPMTTSLRETKEEIEELESKEIGCKKVIEEFKKLVELILQANDDINWLLSRIEKLQCTLGYMVKTGLEMKCELDIQKERIKERNWEKLYDGIDADWRKHERNM